jgi:hypothetical protein
VSSGKIGDIVTGSDVQRAMTDTVKMWSPDYLAEVGEQSGRGRGDLPGFRSYVTLVDLSKFSEDQIPTCVVVAPGTNGVERRSGGYVVEWLCGVGCVVSGQNSENTYELGTLYVAAVRALVVQHKSLGGFAEDISWTGERYDELDSNEIRTITAGVAQFSVFVSSAVDPALGLTVPSVDATIPPGDWPQATTVDITTVGS